MTPIFFNSSSSTDHTYSPYHHRPSDDHHDHLGINNHQFLNPNYSQVALSSSSNSLAATHIFLNSAVDDDDQSSGTFDHREIQPPPPHHHQQLQGDNFGSQANYNKDYSIDHQSNIDMTMINNNNDENQMIKWPMMSSKMRVMLKMKRSDPVNYIKFYSSATNKETPKQRHEDPHQKKKDYYSPATSSCYPIIMEETDNPSINYNTSSNNNNSNNIIPIRVCSDCNTSKTPLWRSGPQGPKSLCNACGIRQRKARRALAIAAAAENSGNNNNILAAVGDQSMVMAPLKVTKSHQSKDFIIKKPNYNNGQVITKFKKRQYVSKTTMVTTTTIIPPSSPSPSPSPSSSSSLAPKKNGVEDFLVSLSNKYLTSFNNNYHVFPQDEKEAAILLMAISCGYAS